MKPKAHYVIRYLEPKEAGSGRITHCFSAVKPSLKELKKTQPELFEAKGFYTFMEATGQTLTVN